MHDSFGGHDGTGAQVLRKKGRKDPVTIQEQLEKDNR